MNRKLKIILLNLAIVVLAVVGYADGLLEAIPAGVLAVAKYCEKNKIPLTVWHYDNKRKNHWPQRMG